MSLARYKRDKITEALLDKGYSRHPEEYDFSWLWSRLEQEASEITHDSCSRGHASDSRMNLSYLDMIKLFEHDISSVKLDDDFWIGLKRELADLSNFVDYLFDSLIEYETQYKKENP